MSDERVSEKLSMITASTPELVNAAVELANTETHHEIGDVLYGLIATSVDLLGVDSAGVLLADEHGSLESAASIHESTRLLELQQLEVDEGPCLDCFRSGKPVSSPDLGCDARWPAFAARARAAGVLSVHAVPMGVGDSTIGALNLFRYRPGPVDESELTIAASFASAATVAVLHLRDRRATHQLADQLQHALTSRIVIEQAKGYLAKLHDEPPHAAFQRLRSHARRHRLPLTTVARLVIEGQLSLT